MPTTDKTNAMLILASSSASRQKMLSDAGLVFGVVAAEIDERAIQEALTGGRENGDVTPDDVAEVLARAKAELVSANHPDAFVIGADQVLYFDGEIFEKPASLDVARRNLLRMRGRTHSLCCSVAVAKNGETKWSHTESAYLTMWNFTPDWLGRHLALAGDDVLSSVGAYQLEGVGVQLFDQIEGDYHTVLGLPLLQLLSYLRSAGVI